MTDACKVKGCTDPGEYFTKRTGVKIAYCWRHYVLAARLFDKVVMR